MNVGTGGAQGHVLQLFPKFACKVPLFSLHGAFFYMKVPLSACAPTFEILRTSLNNKDESQRFVKRA